MHINMTLLIQAIHFLIAYSILKRLLLRPVFGVIEYETMQSDALVDSIESRTVIVQEKKRDCKERWEQCQQDMRAQIPPIEQQRPIFKDISPTYTTVPYSAESIKTITHNVATALTEKAKHVIK
ncbi:MAG: hypothetical protein ACHQVS_03415 [Candidatus Babeliales bacterium]